MKPADVPLLTDTRLKVTELREKLQLRRPSQDFRPLEEFLTGIASDNPPETVEKPPRPEYEIEPEQPEAVKLEESKPNPDPLLWLDGIAQVLNGLYVHLEFKRTRYGANPVDQLRALERNLNLPTPMPAPDFNRAMLNIFRDLHDPHTVYQLPKPYRSYTAFLPFRVAACYDSQASADPQFVVTHVADGFADACPGFVPGARITYWNGLPMAMMVHQLSLRENGANRPASFARAMNTLTIRSLRNLLPPDAPTVTIRFNSPPELDASEKSELIVDWSVRKTEENDNLAALLFDLPTSKTKGWEKWEALSTDRAAFKVLTLRHPTTTDEVRVGVIRIRTFSGEADSLVFPVSRLLDELRRRAPLALIIDVRGNGGGSIRAAERLLQLLTPGPITPASFQSLNTPLLHELFRQNPTEQQRLRTFGLETDRGTIFSRPARLTTDEEANEVGQRYYGRVALITDALCYSATDIFAAGFQDHRIGPVVGVDGSTGGGGASVWNYNANVAGKETEDKWKLPDLPEGANMQFSVRQSLRTGRFKEDVLEDFGVTPDHRYFLSPKDVLEGDQGLYEFALSKLLYGTGLKEISVDVQVSRLTTSDVDDEILQIECQTAGVVRCELLVNKQILSVFEARDEGLSTRNFPASSIKQLEELELRCYNIGQANDFTFYSEEEFKKLGEDGKKEIHRLVASRKFAKALGLMRPTRTEGQFQHDASEASTGVHRVVWSNGYPGSVHE